MTRSLSAALLVAVSLSCFADKREPTNAGSAKSGRTPAPATQAEPRIQSRVRAKVPRLGPGWRVGMFNMTVSQPPCYEVLLFDPGPIRRVVVIIPISEVSRLQVSSLYPGAGAADPDPGASMDDNEMWIEQDLAGVKSTSRCQQGITYQKTPPESFQELRPSANPQ
jgi:hypothetical protein